MCASRNQVFQSYVCQLVTKCVTLMCDTLYKLVSPFSFSRNLIYVQQDRVYFQSRSYDADFSTAIINYTSGYGMTDTILPDIFISCGFPDIRFSLHLTKVSWPSILIYEHYFSNFIFSKFISNFIYIDIIDITFQLPFPILSKHF